MTRDRSCLSLLLHWCPSSLWAQLCERAREREKKGLFYPFPSTQDTVLWLHSWSTTLDQWPEQMQSYESGLAAAPTEPCRRLSGSVLLVVSFKLSDSLEVLSYMARCQRFGGPMSRRSLQLTRMYSRWSAHWSDPSSPLRRLLLLLFQQH